MRDEVKKAVAVWLGAVLAVTLVVGAGAYWVLRASVETLVQGGWGNQVVATADVPRVFGVKLVGVGPRQRSRQLDVSDAVYQGLYELNDEPAFLAANGLRIASEAGTALDAFDLDAAEDEVERLTGTKPAAWSVLVKAQGEPFTTQVARVTAGTTSWVVLESVAR